MTRASGPAAALALLLAIPLGAAPLPVKGPGGDLLPPGSVPGAAGDVIATIPMAIVHGLADVDAEPEAMRHSVQALPPAGVDATRLPEGSWLFGAAPVTKTESISFAVSADRQGLAFDSNGDSRLDPSEIVARETVIGGVAWFPVQGIVRQKWSDATHELKLPMRVAVALSGTASASRLDAYRAGTCRVEGRDVRVAIVDRTFRGCFTHPGRDALMVDVDGDGRFDAAKDSTERYKLGEPFPLGGVDAIVTDVGPQGSTLTIARSTKPARRIASLAVGSPAPTFAFQSVDGATWDLSKLRGKWVLLDFWATWCGPCRAEIPNLAKLHAEQPDVVILGISQDRARAALDGFVAKNGVTWPQALEGTGDVQRAYRVNQLPTSFLIAPDGTIAARDVRGPAMPATVGRLRKILK